MSGFDGDLEGARESAAEEWARQIEERKAEAKARGANVSSSADSLVNIGRKGIGHGINVGRGGYARAEQAVPWVVGGTLLGGLAALLWHGRKR